MLGEAAGLQRAIYAKTGQEYLTWLRDMELRGMGMNDATIDEYLNALCTLDAKRFRQFFQVSVRLRVILCVRGEGLIVYRRWCNEATDDDDDHEQASGLTGFSGRCICRRWKIPYLLAMHGPVRPRTGRFRIELWAFLGKHAAFLQRGVPFIVELLRGDISLQKASPLPP